MTPRRTPPTRRARKTEWLLTLPIMWMLVSCTETNAPAGDDSHVKLGFYSRHYADFTDEAKVSLILTAMRQINESGGLQIQGKTRFLDLEVTHFAEPSPEAALIGFDELAAAGVSGILGPPSSSQLLGSQDKQDGVWRSAVENSLALISESATSPAISDLEDEGLVFRMMPPDTLQGRLGAEEVYQSGHRRVALLYRDDSYGQSLTQVFAERFRELGGTIVAESPYNVEGAPDRLDSYDFDNELESTFEQQPDLVYLATFDEIARIGTRMVQRGDLTDETQVAFFGSDSLYDVPILNSTPPLFLERLRGTTAGVDPDTADYKKFVDYLKEADLGAPWNASAQLYDAVFVFALAMQAADSSEATHYKEHIAPVTRKDPNDVVVYVNDFARARDALLEGKGVNYEGVSGPIEFDEKGDPGSGLMLIWKPETNSEGAYEFEIEKKRPYPAEP